MNKSYRVGIVGGTGMVGQRFATLLENHPWFHVTAIAASGRSAGKTYAPVSYTHLDVYKRQRLTSGHSVPTCWRQNAWISWMGRFS